MSAGALETIRASERERTLSSSAFRVTSSSGVNGFFAFSSTATAKVRQRAARRPNRSSAPFAGAFASSSSRRFAATAS